MSEPKHFPYAHLLHFLSPQNKQMVANYLTLLQARQYAPSTLGAIAGTFKSFCLLLPQPHRDGCNRAIPNPNRANSAYRFKINYLFKSLTYLNSTTYTRNSSNESL